MNSHSAYENATVIVCAFTLVIGTVGNALVLFIVGRQKRKQTVHDAFILNLAFADFIFVCIHMPLYMALYFDALSVSPFLCHVLVPVVTTAFIASIFTITSMAIQRCRVITNPWKRKMTRGRAIIWSAVNWVLALIITLPFMVVNKPRDGSCAEDWQTANLKRAYTTCLVALQYLLPLLIIVGCYVKMSIFLQNSRAQLISISRQGRTGGMKSRKENMVIFKTIAVIVIAFAVCLLPAQVLWVLTDFASAEFVQQVWLAHFAFAANILATFHSCLNPVIYGTVNKHFRREYAKYLTFLCKCKSVDTDRNCSHCRQRRGSLQKGRNISTGTGNEKQTIESPAFREEVAIRMSLLVHRVRGDYQTNNSWK